MGTLSANTDPPATPVFDYSTRRASSRVPPLLLSCLAVAVGYFVLARVSLLFVASPMGVAVVWPANGLTLAALLLAPRRWWAALLLSGYAGNVAASVMVDRPLLATVSFALVNVAEVLASAAAMRWLSRGPVALSTVREVVAFAVVACAGGGALGGLLGAFLATRFGPADYQEAWRLWAVVDALGMLAVTPAIVTLCRHRSTPFPAARRVEATACLVTFALACEAIFGQSGQHRAMMLNFPYVAMLPFLLWAGLRFDPRVVAMLSVSLVVVGGWNTVNGRGPMTRDGFTVVESVIAFQASAMLWVLSALVLGAVTAERKAAADALAASEARARRAEGQARLAEGQARLAEAQAREAERAATETGGRVQAIFDNAAAAIFVKDLDGRYLAINRAMERNLGRPAAEMLGRTDTEVFPGPAGQAARVRDQEVIARGAPIEYSIEYVTPAGRTETYWTVKFPVRDPDGTIRSVCGMSTDVTSLKQAELGLRAAKEEAEANAKRAEANARQAEANARRAEENAARAQALAWRADAANRAKSDFLANISHEIRTPLTAIFGYADLLTDPAVTAAERFGHVQTIRRNGEHLLAVLDDVLDMSKIEAGRMTVERVECDVPRLVGEVLSLVRQRAVEKGLGLWVDFATPVPAVVKSDPTRVRQILINLVGNGVKFTEAGGVHVDLRLDESHREPELVFEVTDTGIGMTPEQVALLGQPFSQADPSHARRFGGTGLGISICYRLAELIGGSITCQSRPNDGSTFTFRLPTGDLTGVPRVTGTPDVAAGPPPASVAAAVAAAAGAAVAGARVLVAEDSPDTRRLLVAILRKAGIEVETAENGQVAVARAMGAWRSGRAYDLVLMDVQMPQMDGLTATGVLRSHQYPGRVVALTANAMDQDRRRCLDAGCDGFLAKPIRGAALLDAVRRFLAGPAEPPAATSSPSAVPEDGPPPAGAADGSPRLRSELADDPDVGPLLLEYLHELGEKMVGLGVSVTNHDWPGVARLAHQVKGSAGGYGYPSLSAAAAELEHAARNSDPAAKVPPAAQRLVALCREATGGEGKC